MNEFVTIKQASQLTSKHPDTIRHLIRKNKTSKLVTKDSKGRVLVSTELLNREYDLTKSDTPEASQKATEINTQQHTSDTEKSPQTGLESVIQALTSQLEAKDKQIDSLQQIIHEKENNTTKLQDQFQQLLARQQLPTTTHREEEENLRKPNYEPEEAKTKNPKKTASKKKKNITKTKNKKSGTTSNKPKSTKKTSWWRRS